MTDTTQHTVRFEKKRFSPHFFRAVCTCGWQEYRDDLARLQAMAAVHDLEQWEPVDPEANDKADT
jgi:hypothetical protein